VAAGYFDGFFETGLSPWDIAAASLIITEAGGLIGNFSGEADFLYQREVVAGNPKVYGQLVGILAPYTRVIKGDGPGASAEGAEASPDATDAFIAATTEPAAAPAEAKPRKALKVSGPRTPRQRSGA
jgi:myo-inositol-1(or 4)-monophosphatase